MSIWLPEIVWFRPAAYRMPMFWRVSRGKAAPFRSVATRMWLLATVTSSNAPPASEIIPTDRSKSRMSRLETVHPW